MSAAGKTPRVMAVLVRDATDAQKFRATRVVDFPQSVRVEYRRDSDNARDALSGLIGAAQAFLDAQVRLDNHELMGPNAEHYSVLMRRRNAARSDLEKALDNVGGAE